MMMDISVVKNQDPSAREEQEEQRSSQSSGPSPNEVGTSCFKVTSLVDSLAGEELVGWVTAKEAGTAQENVNEAPQTANAA